MSLCGDCLLEQELATVFEEMTFMFLEPLDEPEPWPGEGVLARLAFHGPESGEMLLAAEPDLAVEIAANLLGMEPDSPDAEASKESAVSEMLNVLAGILLHKMFPDPDVATDLGVPEQGIHDGEHLEKILSAAYERVRMVGELGSRVDFVITVAAQGA